MTPTSNVCWQTQGLLSNLPKCIYLCFVLLYFNAIASGKMPKPSFMQPPIEISNMYSYKYSYIDKTGRIVIDAGKYQAANSFSDGLAAVYVENKGWGFIDKAGQEVIKPQFQEAGNFSEGLASAQIKGKWGFIDKTGRVVIEPQYDAVNSFSEGIAVVVKGPDFFLINKTGQTILSRNMSELQLSVYDNARFSGGLIDAFDCATSKTGFIDKTGKFVVEPKYEQAAPFSEGLARVAVNEGGEEKMGFIDRSGQLVIPPKFNTDSDFSRNSTDFSEGLASLTEGLAPSVTAEAKFIYINKKGSIVLSTNFFNAGPFRSGIAVVYDNESDKWGFIDKSGNVVIPLRYDIANDFSEGLACVAFLATGTT